MNQVSDLNVKPAASPEALAEAWLANPVKFKTEAPAHMHGYDRAALEAIQLEALKTRFAQLRDRVPMLTRLADDVGVSRIDSLDDVVPLLFKHTIYKSYPVSLLEKCRFPQLMQWLNKLVTLDLSKIDVSHCGSIDEWLSELDRQTPLRVRYSSGTSGTMSFLAQTADETDRQFLNNAIGLFDSYGLAPPTVSKPLSMRVVLPNYRYGATAWARYADYQVKYMCGGDESRCYTLYQGSVSADLMFLAGRIRAAQQRGDLDRLELGPSLLVRKTEFEEMQRRAPAELQSFFDRVAAELRGQQIYTQAPWSPLHNIAITGLERGIENVFSPDSIIVAAGGSKGQVVPDDWEEKARRFFGVKRLTHMYGMTEVMGANYLCEHNRYHIDPCNLLFILDPDSGEPLPRKGVQTGRAAFYDLMAESHWGGFITGDELSVDWDTTCACGQTTPHVARKVERYSNLRGGDDKISCASVSDAHEEALNFLVDVGN